MDFYRLSISSGDGMVSAQDFLRIKAGPMLNSIGPAREG